MKLKRLLPRYYAQTDTINQLVEAVDSIRAEDELLQFFDNISVDTNLTDLKSQIVDYIAVNLYGSRIKNYNLTEDDKIKICSIFAMLEDLKGNIGVITRLYKRFGWDVLVTRILGDGGYRYRVLPVITTAPGTAEEFNNLALRLNPFLERYYIPLDVTIISPVGFAIQFPKYTREVTTSLTTAVTQNLYTHRSFGNEQILNDDPEEYIDTDYNYVTELEVIVT